MKKQSNSNNAATIFLGSIFAFLGGLSFLIGVFAKTGAIKVHYEGSTNGDPENEPWIFILVGGIFLIIGLAFLITTIKGMFSKKSLMKNGECISAVIRCMERTGVTINNRRQFRFVCEFSDPFSGMFITAKSGLTSYFEDFGYDTEKYIDVYYDHDDPSKYYVDIDSYIANNTGSGDYHNTHGI